MALKLLASSLANSSTEDGNVRSAAEARKQLVPPSQSINFFLTKLTYLHPRIERVSVVCTCREYQWVEIIEPGSGRPVYANVHSGDCLWHPPPDVQLYDGVACHRCLPCTCTSLPCPLCSSKPAGNDQWWELIDAKSSRPYYYNASTKQTVWVRPATGDIVALAKLQQAQKAMLAQEQELKAKEERDARVKQQQLEAAMQQQQLAAPASRIAILVRHRGTCLHLSCSQRSSCCSRPRPHYEYVVHAPPPYYWRRVTLCPAAAAPKARSDIGTSASTTPKLQDLQDDLSTHKKGLFRRKVSLHNMLSWSRDCIPRPMLLSLSKDQRKTAIDMFKMVQQYMGDRSVKGQPLQLLLCTAVVACPALCVLGYVVVVPGRRTIP